MKKANSEKKDELRPEYDLRSLRVRKVGPERKNFGGPTVRLEPDVAEVFPDSDPVNEALRFLIKITRKKSRSSLAPAVTPKKSASLRQKDFCERGLSAVKELSIFGIGFW